MHACAVYIHSTVSVLFSGHLTIFNIRTILIDFRKADREAIFRENTEKYGRLAALVYSSGGDFLMMNFAVLQLQVIVGKTNVKEMWCFWLSIPVTIVYSRSPESWKLCGVRIAINYTPLSMAYYAYETYS